MLEQIETRSASIWTHLLGQPGSCFRAALSLGTASILSLDYQLVEEGISSLCALAVDRTSCTGVTP